MQRRDILLSMAAAASFVATPFARAATAIDASGAKVETASAPRIVSIGSDVTETIHALGRGHLVIAVDTTSNFPDTVRQLPNVGYMRALSAEGVLALDPDLILASDGAGPPEAIGILRSSGIAFASIPDEPTPAGVARKVRLIGAILNAEESAATLAHSIDAQFAHLARLVAGLSRQRALFILSLAGDRIVAAGSPSSAAAMMALAGAENALAGFEGYKPVSAEAVVAAKPEAIIMMKRDTAPDAGQLFGSQPFAATPAARDRRLIVMDGAYLLAFGPRSAVAARDLAAALHPDTDFPSLR
jgi:iron complex transport system substrate-binding protein